MDKSLVEKELSKFKNWVYSAYVEISDLAELEFIGTKVNFSNDGTRLILSNDNEDSGDRVKLNIIIDKIKKFEIKVYKEEYFMPNFFITI